MLISDLVSALPYDSNNWDAKRIETCDCDAGFGGPDCSLRTSRRHAAGAQRA